MKTNFKDSVQVFGRSLLLPIAVMAPIGMVMGITGALTQNYMISRFPFLGNEFLNMLINSLKSITSVVFDNIPLLFAMGVAYGMSKKEKGIAVFAAVLAYLTLNIVMNVYLKTTGLLVTKGMSQVGQGIVLGIHTLKIDAAGGIISGLIAAKMTDKFYKLELPLAFAFFSGKKSVPIITFMFMIPVGIVVPVVWGVITKILLKSSFIFMNDKFGLAVYWFMHRSLIPFGLHHVLASIVRFTEAGGTYMIEGQAYIGILNAVNHVLFVLGSQSPYWNELMPKLTSYLGAGQMLTTLFRVPAIGLAMYHTSYARNKKIAGGVILTVVLTAFLGNVTEPLEFSFLFIAPQLFVVYAVLCGIMALPLNFLNVSIGYIRGTIFDFGIFGLLYENTHWVQLILLGIVNFVVFYVVFRFAITKFNLETPGREQGEMEDNRNNQYLKEKQYGKVAEIVVEGLGGKDNIINAENCITRLRVDIKNKELINQAKLKEAGASGIFFPQENHIHVVFGPYVEFVKNAVDDYLKK